MKDTGIDPLPPDIADLLAREAAAYPEDAAMKAAVLAHTEMAIALGAAATAAEVGRVALRAGAFGGRALAAVGVSAFLAGGVTGGLVVKAVSSAPAPSSPVVATASATTVAPPSPSVLPSAEVPAATDAASAPPASAAPPVSAASSASAAPSASAARGDLTRERELLDAAHAALARGRPGDALAAAERHAAQWPRGYLGEEREVVIIQALAASGRRGEAAPRAERFRKSHPKSMLLPVVDAAVPPAP